MSGFKLLAIVPLNGCDKRFTNNLEVGEVYKFYQDYDIRCESDDTKITYYANNESQKNSTLFDLKNGINVNISAVVGLNGSGKSSIIELLYYFIYKLGIEYEAYDSPSIYAHSGHNKNLKRQFAELRNKLKNSESKSFEISKAQHNLELNIKDINREEIEQLTETEYLAKIDKLLEQKIIYHEKQAATDKELEKNINDSFKAAIVYEMEEGIFALYSQGEKTELKRLFPPVQDETKPLNFDLNDFFYTVSLNYSHHSLNSKSIGNWINSLFHKNDAYTTPLVINPMRNEGNFDVNKELHLNNERLFATITYNLVKNNEARLLNKYSVTKFVFRVKEGIVPVFCKGLKQRSNWFSERNKNLLLNSETLHILLDKSEFDELLSVKWIKKHLQIDDFDYDFPFLNYAIGYLESKIDKLKYTYPQFFQKDGEIDQGKFDNFLQSETTHITKKFRQTLNFLKIVYEHDDTCWENPTTITSNHLNTEVFLNWLKLNHENPSDLSPLGLLEFAMPGFTTVDYELETDNDRELGLKKMSSGEQQMLFNINTIVYHLLNLQSIFNSKDDEIKRVKYKNVSIILDEIELYYHPDMQRLLVKNILDALENIRLDSESGIESINICFLTHSPFILSDIPSSNILRLEEGLPELTKSQTFGANIHDLLANDFFLENGFMGEFAKEKIQSLVRYLTGKRNRTKEWSIDSATNFIEIIGEPYIKRDLLGLLKLKKDKAMSIKEIENQIAYLNELKIKRQ